MEFQSQRPKTSAAAKVSKSLLLCLGWVVLAEQSVMAPAATTDSHPPGAPIQVLPIHVNADMVLVGVTVVDSFGRIITGLKKNNFKVYDERVCQEIATFSAEDVPASVGIVFDSSASMTNTIERSKDAAYQFFKTSNPEDEFMLIDFNDSPHLLSGFTSQVEALEVVLPTLAARGRTALLDAIYLGLNEMKGARSNRKALVVISDGFDNRSRYTEKEVENAVKESDTQVYAIAILGPTMFRWLPGEKSGPAMLARLANLSGGNMFPAANAAELPAIAQKISLALRNQYVIGYRPSNLVRDGRWRHINLELVGLQNPSDLRVYNRSGYYAPGQ